MSRLARIVIPGVAHHITQRGNRRLPVFFSGDDQRAYLALVADACADHGTVCLGWCLMDNHVDIVIVSSDENGLRRTFADTHRRYTGYINAPNC